ncbi:MAG: OsmC family protein [Pseudomonadota bacterium]
MTNDTLEKPAKVAINGVDVPTLLGTIAAVGEQPIAAQFQFRADSSWVTGTHSRATINGYFGAGQEHARADDFTVEADHPAVLCGGDNAPNPMEYLLSALAACLTAGIGNIASARQIKLTAVNVKVEGSVDLQGLLGLDKSVRNGFQNVRATVEIQGDADSETLTKVVQQSIARSAVYDMLTQGTKVAVDLAA